ncbi:MAG: hypothetical protein U0168_08180 [Nannocystaceae bacterium]
MSARWLDPSSASPRGLARMVAAAAVFAGVAHAWRWRFLCDDAYISFRYARNFARHGELAFNVAPLERVEGYTNFLWVAVLGVLDRVGVAPEHAAIALGLASLAAVLLCAAALVRRLGGEAHTPWFAALAVALCAATPEVVVWGTSGLETAAAGAAVLAAMVAWYDAQPRRAALAAAAAVLLRPDAVVLLGAWAAIWLLLAALDRFAQPWPGRTPPSRRALAVAAALAIGPVLAHLLWRRAYYGTWVPNTWAVKAHGAALREAWGVAYVHAWSTATWLPYLPWVVPLLRRRALPLLAAGAAMVAYAWSVGGDFMAYSRFLLAATVLLAVLVALALQRGAELLAARSGRPRLVFAVALALGVLAVAAQSWSAASRWQADRRKPDGWLDGRWEGVTAMARFAEVGRAAGTWMREHLPPDTLITVGAAGAVPYASELPTIDAFGLVDPVLASLDPLPLRTGESVRPGHQLFAPPEYIRSRDPDLLCHAGMRGKAPPREADARPPFRGGYVWACVQPGPGAAIAPDGERFDPGVYCCRRPRDRVVGPFGAAEVDGD